MIKLQMSLKVPNRFPKNVLKGIITNARSRFNDEADRLSRSGVISAQRGERGATRSYTRSVVISNVIDFCQC